MSLPGSGLFVDRRDHRRACTSSPRVDGDRAHRIAQEALTSARQHRRGEDSRRAHPPERQGGWSGHRGRRKRLRRRSAAVRRSSASWGCASAPLSSAGSMTLRSPPAHGDLSVQRARLRGSRGRRAFVYGHVFIADGQESCRGCASSSAQRDMEVVGEAANGHNRYWPRRLSTPAGRVVLHGHRRPAGRRRPGNRDGGREAASSPEEDAVSRPHGARSSRATFARRRTPALRLPRERAPSTPQEGSSARYSRGRRGTAFHGRLARGLGPVASAEDGVRAFSRRRRPRDDRSPVAASSRTSSDRVMEGYHWSQITDELRLGIKSRSETYRARRHTGEVGAAEPSPRLVEIRARSPRVALQWPASRHPSAATSS